MPVAAAAAVAFAVVPAIVVAMLPRCMQTSAANTHTRTCSGNTKTRTLTRWCPHVSARAFICRFRFRLSSWPSSPLLQNPPLALKEHPAPFHCGQLQSSDCALISCCCTAVATAAPAAVVTAARTLHVMHLEVSRFP